MPVCSYYDDTSGFSLEEQTKNYLLDLISPASCAVQDGQVTLQILNSELTDLQTNICSDFELQIGFETGNHVIYTYETDDQEITLVVYVINLT